MEYTYIPKGTCSKQMVIEIDETTDTIKSVRIMGGCPGNTIGLSRMVVGRKIDEVITLLKGVPCGVRGTSCPDQLAIALEGIKKVKEGK